MANARHPITVIAGNVNRLRRVRIVVWIVRWERVQSREVQITTPLLEQEGTASMASREGRQVQGNRLAHFELFPCGLHSGQDILETRIAIDLPGRNDAGGAESASHAGIHALQRRNRRRRLSSDGRGIGSALEGRQRLRGGFESPTFRL